MNTQQRFQLAMEQGRAAMEPHLDKMESANGMLAMLMISGIAQLVATGQESQAALAHSIKQASVLSGIPEEALEAHAHFATVMVDAYELDQQPNKNPR